MSRRAHLVLGSGGIRCLAFVGALEHLVDQGWVFASVSTCSAGTVVGALLCSGVPPTTIRKLAEEVAPGVIGRAERGGWARRLWTLRAWPFALYPQPGAVEVYEEIVSRATGRTNLTLGDLDPPLSAAAVDINASRLLVYSTTVTPEMPVKELLSIVTAVPLIYPPRIRKGRELVDAAVAWHTPVWLVSGFPEPLEVVVLRAGSTATIDTRGRVDRWFTTVLGSAVDSRDTFLLEQTPRLRVIDMPSPYSPFDFTVDRQRITELMDAGKAAAVDAVERHAEQRLSAAVHRPPVDDGAVDDDSRAQSDAVRRYGAHLRRVMTGRVPTVFVSYAHEDIAWVERIRKALLPLIADASISVWDDSYIAPGANWDASIRDALDRARVAVLVLSRPFLASTYIQSTELRVLLDQALEGRTALFWLPLDDAPPPEELARNLQAVTNPERPVATMTEAEQDETIAKLARLVSQALDDRGEGEPAAARAAL